MKVPKFILAFSVIGICCYGDVLKTNIGSELENIITALSSYKIDYGAFPSGKSLDVMRALTGANPRKIVFLDLDKRYLDSNGRFLDPWGSPLLIIFSGADSVEVRSAGADKAFNTPDDKWVRKTPKGSSGTY